MAYLKKRGNKWYAVWHDNGKAIVKATGIPVKGKKEEKLALQTAESMEAAAKGNISLSRALDAVRSVAQTIGMSNAVPITIDYFSNHKPVGGESNQLNSRHAFKTFLDFLGCKKVLRLDRITPAICQDYCRHRLTQVSFGTAKHNVAHIKTVFKAAVRDGYLDRNPFDSFSLASLSSSCQRQAIKRLPFTPQELNTIISTFPSPWPELTLTSLLTGGQRLGDICCLKWASVNFTSNIIAFNTQKTGKEIIVPMHPQLRALFQQREGNGSEYIFPEAACRYTRSKGSLSVEFTTLLKAHCILTSDNSQGEGNRRPLSQKSFHSIRHTVVTLLRSSNAFSADIARQIVGHDSEEIERQYFTASNDTKAQGIDYLFNSVQKGGEH